MILRFNFVVDKIIICKFLYVYMSLSYTSFAVRPSWQSLFLLAMMSLNFASGILLGKSWYSFLTLVHFLILVLLTEVGGGGGRGIDGLRFQPFWERFYCSGLKKWPRGLAYCSQFTVLAVLGDISWLLVQRATVPLCSFCPQRFSDFSSLHRRFLL